jgi:hypothetical protein
VIGAVLLGLACMFLLAGTASAAAPQAAEAPSPPGGFRLQGSHGFSISVAAYSEVEGSGHGEIVVTASRAHEFVSYTAPAQVTTDSIRARLGTLGRVDMVLNRSGREETVNPPCFHHPESFETGTYEGVFEFSGEGGYTDARATRAAAVPSLAVFSRRIGCNGGSSGESFGPGEPGARLLGVSYANGRTVKFQINKNRPTAKTIFTASLAERRGGINIFRGTERGGSRRRLPLRPEGADRDSQSTGTLRRHRSPDAQQELRVAAPRWRSEADLPGPHGEADRPRGPCQPEARPAHARGQRQHHRRHLSLSRNRLQPRLWLTTSMLLPSGSRTKAP